MKFVRIAKSVAGEPATFHEFKSKLFHDMDLTGKPNMRVAVMVKDKNMLDIYVLLMEVPLTRYARAISHEYMRHIKQAHLTGRQLHKAYEVRQFTEEEHVLYNELTARF